MWIAKKKVLMYVKTQAWIVYGIQLVLSLLEHNFLYLFVDYL